MEQMRFNLTACAYGMLSLHPLGLIKFLVERGCKQSSVRKQIQRARLLNRDELRAPRPPRATDRIPLKVVKGYVSPGLTENRRHFMGIISTSINVGKVQASCYGCAYDGFSLP